MDPNFDQLKGIGLPINLLRSDVVPPPITLTERQEKWQRIMMRKAIKIVDDIALGNSEIDKSQK